MTAALNKYEVLLTSVKCNAISSEQEYIIALIYIVKKLNDDNFKLSNTVKKTYNIVREREISHNLGNNNNIIKGKGKKERHIFPQKKWKPESPK